MRDDMAQVIVERPRIPRSIAAKAALRPSTICPRMRACAGRTRCAATARNSTKT